LRCLCRCYAGKGHPELAAEKVEASGEVELVFSYVCNTAADSYILFEEGQLGLYVPTFVRVYIAPTAAAEEAEE
jgi:hypothetical protein